MNTNSQANNIVNKKINRNSSIELLKIIAIFIIVICHVCQTVGLENSCISVKDFILNTNLATDSFQIFIIILLEHLGNLGNAIFFISSCWFLVDSKKKTSLNKIVYLIIEIFTVSIIMLIISYSILGNTLNKQFIKQSFFPTTFSNNWYLTCYILFLIIYPYLNIIINNMTQKEHLAFCLFLSNIYFLLNFIKRNLFFVNNIIIWISIYFCISYIKRYMNNFIINKKINFALLIGGILGNILLISITNIIGLKNDAYRDKVLYWNVLQNPLTILTAIGIVNIASNYNFNNNIINKIASLSLLNYIIHENLLIRKYFRPLIFVYIYQNFGYERILFWVLLVAILVFIASTIISFIYSKTIKNITSKVAEKLSEIITKRYDNFTKKYFNL